MMLIFPYLVIILVQYFIFLFVDYSVFPGYYKYKGNTNVIVTYLNTNLNKTTGTILLYIYIVLYKPQETVGDYKPI